MEDRQTQRRDRDHNAIKNNKLNLILHDGVCPAARHLSDTEHATGEDDEESEDDGPSEELEVARGEQVDGRLREAVAAAVGPVDVVPNQNPEDQQRGDLPGDTGHHEVVPDILVGLGIGCGGDASARALEDEREQIAEDEDPGVEFGSYPGVVAADGQDEVFQGQVDAGGDEGGGDDEAGDLDVEARVIEWVVVEQYAADVS